MKLIFLSNNEVSEPLIEWLSKRTELLLLSDKLTLEHIKQFKPELIVSYSYKHILSQDVLSSLPNSFINLHISLLPYNRGADPNAWSFLENTPKGVSIHLIDKGIDTGAILLQQEVKFNEEMETLGQSYVILQEQIQALFRDNWDSLKDGIITPIPQTNTGTFHKASEFLAVKNQLLGEEGWSVPISVFKERYKILKNQAT